MVSSSIQRALEFTPPFGENLHYTFVTPEVGEGLVGEKRIFSLGGPNLRTNWNIQSITLEAAFIWKWKKGAAEIGEELQCIIRALNDSVPTGFLILKGKRPEVKDPTNFSIPRKSIVLELFAPVTIYGGHSLSFEFEFRGAKTIELGSRQIEFKEPRLTVIYEQEHYK